MLFETEQAAQSAGTLGRTELFVIDPAGHQGRPRLAGVQRDGGESWNSGARARCQCVVELRQGASDVGVPQRELAANDSRCEARVLAHSGRDWSTLNLHGLESSCRRASLFSGGHDHAHPHVRHSAAALETKIDETALGEEGGEGGPAPEFDVAAIPQWVVVEVPLVDHGHCEILEISVIRRGQDDRAAWLEG